MASQKRLAQAEEHMQNARKHLKTGIFKWNADYDSAASEYQKAATCYKNAKAYEDCKKCYITLSELQKEMKTEFHAGKSLEQAALCCKEMKRYGEAGDLVGKACNLFLEYGTPDTAAIALERAAKMIEGNLPDKAIGLYMRAADVLEGEDRPRQAAEMIGKACKLFIRQGKLEEAFKAVAREIQFNKESENYPIIAKRVVIQVLIQLHLTDYVAASRCLSQAMGVPEFSDSDECEALSAVLDAYDQGDQETADIILRKPVFTYLENDVVKLARSLVVPGGIPKAAAPTDGETGEPQGVDDEADDEYAGGLL